MSQFNSDHEGITNINLFDRQSLTASTQNAPRIFYVMRTPHSIKIIKFRNVRIKIHLRRLIKNYIFIESIKIVK